MGVLSIDPNQNFYYLTKFIPVSYVIIFVISAIGTLLPFLSIYMRQLGLNATETSIIYGVMPFVAFLVKPIVGSLVDKYRKHKVFLIVSFILMGTFYLSLLFIPGKDKTTTVHVSTNIHCNPQDSYVSDCTDEALKKDGQPFHCPLKLRDYANLTGISENSTAIKCVVNCQYAIPGAYLSRVCFTSQVTAQHSGKTCKDIYVSSSKDAHVTFTITDVGHVMREEVVRDRLTLNSFSCRDYNLKSLRFEQKDYWQMLCEKETVLNCDFHCDYLVDDGCENKKIEMLGLTFWMFLLLFLCANIALAPIISLIDAICYDTLGERRGKWGKQRLFGSMGFALFAVTSTFVMDIMSRQDLRIDYSVSFYIFTVLCLISAVIAGFLKTSDTLRCASVMNNLCKLFADVEILTFLVMVFTCGIMTGAIEGFLFWYLQDLGSSQVNMGLALLVTCLSEMPLLFFAGTIIKRIGTVNCIYLSLAAYALRFLCYSFIQNSWYVLPIETLHGVTFGLFYAAASSYGSIIAPAGMSGTLQGLIGGIHFGFGTYFHYKFGCKKNVILASVHYKDYS